MTNFLERRKAEVRRSAVRRSSQNLAYYVILLARGWLLSASAASSKGATPNLGALLAEVGDMKVARRLPHRPLAAPVVAGRGRGSEYPASFCTVVRSAGS